MNIPILNVNIYYIIRVHIIQYTCGNLNEIKMYTSIFLRPKRVNFYPCSGPFDVVYEV